MYISYMNTLRMRLKHEIGIENDLFRVNLHNSLHLQLPRRLDHVRSKQELLQVFKRMRRVFIYEINLKLYRTTNS